MKFRASAILVAALTAVIALPVGALAAGRFTDVNDSDTHASAIAWLVENGLTEGCNDGTEFCGSQPVTRGQLASFMHRLATSGAVDAGVAGPTGPAGPTGAPGPAGPPGTPGAAGVNDAAHFFALMPPDNAATVAVGGDVDFPQDGPTTGGINRTGADTFALSDIGVYRVSFQVSVTEPGQLIVTLNGADLAYTVAGRATGTSQIATTVLVQTTAINSILTVRNAAGNSTALTITPLAGGTRPVSAALLIERIG